MKKIVALVLSLAMILALGTVAFAATNYDGYQTCEINAGKLGDPQTATLSKTDAGTYNVAYWTIGEQKYVETKTPGEKDLAVIAKGDSSKAVLFYLTKAADIEVEASEQPSKVDASAKLVDFTAQLTKDTKACGKYLLASFDSAKTYYAIVMKDGTPKYVYVKDSQGEKSVKVGDEIVKVTALDGVAEIEHHWVGASFDAKTGKVTSAKCDICKATAKVTTDYAVAKAAGEFAMFDATTYVYGFGTAAAATTTGVTSAKTFDAGVAMYAGLALMSVAGSAVVIGKKKEF